MKNGLLHGKSKATAAFLLIAAAVIIMSFLLHDFVVYIDINQTEIGKERLKEITLLNAGYVKNKIGEYTEYIQGLSERLSKYDDLLLDETKDFFKNISNGTQFYLIAIDLLSGDSHTCGGNIVKISDLSRFKSLESGDPLVTDSIKSASEGLSIEIICPIMKNGAVAGAVRGVLNPGVLSKAMDIDIMPFDGEGYLKLFDSKGECLTFSGGKNVLMIHENYFDSMKIVTFDVGYSHEEFESDISKRKPNFTSYSYGGEHKYAYSKPIGINKWYVTMTVPKWVIDNNSKMIHQKAICTVMQIALVLIAVFLFIIYFIKRSKDEISRINKELLIGEKRYRLMLERSESVIFEYTFATKLIKFSEKFEILFNRKPIVTGLPHSAVLCGSVHPESVETLLRIISDANNGVPSTSGEIRIRDGSGKYIWCLISIVTVLDEKNVPEKALGIIEIISEKKELENKYNFEVQKYKHAIDSENFIVCDVNLTKNYYLNGYEDIVAKTNIRSNNNYIKILKTIARDYFHISNVKDFTDKNCPRNLISLYKSGVTDPAFEHKINEKYKDRKWLYFKYKLYEDPSTKDICAIISITDISKQKQREAELIEKAEKDQMTGLYNKITTEKLINEWIHSHENSLGTLMMIDIDNFKNVNDSFGHQYGDTILIKLAEDLKPMFRANDIVGRIGGDEFFIFLKDLYSEKLISDKAKEVCRLFHNVYKEKDVSCEISASIGIALFPKHGYTLDALYRNADTALYLSKEKGKNGFTIYDERDFKA